MTSCVLGVCQQWTLPLGPALPTDESNEVPEEAPQTNSDHELTIIGQILHSLQTVQSHF